MSARGAPRWALSFADLCLLLLGFFVLLQARPDAHALTDSLHAAFGVRPPPALDVRADAWFEPGEAVLRPAARARLRAVARGADRATVASRGTDANAARFDGWELAAARTAAVARELAAAGIAPARIRLAIDPATGGGQVIRVGR